MNRPETWTALAHGRKSVLGNHEQAYKCVTSAERYMQIQLGNKCVKRNETVYANSDT